MRLKTRCVGQFNVKKANLILNGNSMLNYAINTLKGVVATPANKVAYAA